GNDLFHGLGPGSPSIFGGGTGYITATAQVGGAGAGMGGAIFSDGGSVTIANSTLLNNTVAGGDNGLGIGANNGQSLGGAIFVHNGSLSITSSTIANNTAADGGGALFAVGDSGMVNVTIGNTILADSTGGAADFQSAVINNGSRMFSGTGN